MQVNVDQNFTDMDGKVIKDGETDFTFKVAAVRSLNLPAKIDGDEKMKRFRLARKIYKGGDVDLTTTEWDLVKRCINDAFESPLIYSEACEMIEGATKEG